MQGWRYDSACGRASYCCYTASSVSYFGFTVGSQYVEGLGHFYRLRIPGLKGLGPCRVWDCSPVGLQRWFRFLFLGLGPSLRTTDMGAWGVGLPPRFRVTGSGFGGKSIGIASVRALRFRCGAVAIGALLGRLSQPSELLHEQNKLASKYTSQNCLPTARSPASFKALKLANTSSPQNCPIPEERT